MLEKGGGLCEIAYLEEQMPSLKELFIVAVSMDVIARTTLGEK